MLSIVNSAGVVPSVRLFAAASLAPRALSTLTRRAAVPIARSRLLPPRRNFVRIIEQGYEGWRLTLGKSPERLHAGLAINLPIIHTMQKVDMREQSVDVNDLVSFTLDNVPVKLSGSLFYQIVDGYKACFKVSNVHSNVLALGTSAIRSAVGRYAYDEIISDRNRLNITLREIVASGIDDWGVECRRFEIQRFAPSNRDVERQLEMQMEAERNRRKQILDTQALVNVAEGQKDSDILRAEGRAAAITREAEARKTEAVLHAQGLADQIAAVAAQMDGDKSLAADLLVRFENIRQLQAIAKGSGNSTYFLPQLDAMSAYNVDLVEKLKNASTPTSKQASGLEQLKQTPKQSLSILEQLKSLSPQTGNTANSQQ